MLLSAAPLASTGSTVLDGSLLLAVPIAIAAGFVSFLSPCVLPLVPGYLGYVTGLTGIDLEEQRRGRMVAGAGLFVLGFTVVYVILGWTFGTLGAWLLEYQDALMRILGVLTIGLGLLFAGWLPDWMPGVDSSRTLAVRPAAGLAGAPLLGAVFGLGWTACTGPTLAAILALAGLGGDAARGAILATAYCLGLGIPFVLTALAYRRALGAFAVARRHRLAIARAGGVMLVLVGLMLTTGLWAQLLSRIQGSITGFETAI
jgi:cytochrome c-type biogenesis protein